MGQVLHGSARTTAAVRRAIHQRQERVKNLAERYALNPKTGAKWKKRPFVHAAPMGPKQARSPVLTPEHEAMGVACRRHTLLPLDDGLYALQRSIPGLTRSSCQRCFQRQGIRHRPEVAGDTPTKQKVKHEALGSFPLDRAAGQTAAGRLSLFVARDRASQVAFAERHETARRRIAANVRRALIAAGPSKSHTVLTANGTQFTALAHFRNGVERQEPGQQPDG